MTNHTTNTISMCTWTSFHPLHSRLTIIEKSLFKLSLSVTWIFTRLLEIYKNAYGILNVERNKPVKAVAAGLDKEYFNDLKYETVFSWCWYFYFYSVSTFIHTVVFSKDSKNEYIHNKRNTYHLWRHWLHQRRYRTRWDET